MQQLQQLGQTEPAQLKQTLADIATKMRGVAQGADAASGTSAAASSTAASSTTGSTSIGATMLSTLADQFDQAAQTGDLTSLMPPGPPPSGGPRSAGGSRAEAAYAAAGPTGGSGDVTLHDVDKRDDAQTGRASTPDTEVQQRIAALRQEIEALTAALSNQGAGSTTA